MKKSYALRFFVAIFSVLVLSPSVVAAAEEIKIASTGAGLSTLPLEIAARKGFFRDEGFDVLTITMRDQYRGQCATHPQRRIRHPQHFSDKRRQRRFAG